MQVCTRIYLENSTCCAHHLIIAGQPTPSSPIAGLLKGKPMGFHMPCTSTGPFVQVIRFIGNGDVSKLHVPPSYCSLSIIDIAKKRIERVFLWLKLKQQFVWTHFILLILLMEEFPARVDRLVACPHLFTKL